MSRKLLIKTKGVKIDPSRRKHITRDDLVILENKVISIVQKNAYNQSASVGSSSHRVLR